MCHIIKHHVFKAASRCKSKLLLSLLLNQGGDTVVNTVGNTVRQSVSLTRLIDSQSAAG